jgi:hypothetical protein
VSDDDEEVPQPPTELPPGWKPGDMLPPEGGGGTSPGLLARGGMALPVQSNAANEVVASATPGEQLQSHAPSGDGSSGGKAPIDTLPHKSGLTVHPDFQAVVDDMKRDSPTFSELAKTLDAASNQYRLSPGSRPYYDPARTICWGGVCGTTIDPGKVANVQYAVDASDPVAGKAGKLSPMTLKRAIAHEMAHQYQYEIEPGWGQIGPGEGVPIDIENMIMREIDPSSPARDPSDDRLFLPGHSYAPKTLLQRIW